MKGNLLPLSPVASARRRQRSTAEMENLTVVRVPRLDRERGSRREW